MIGVQNDFQMHSGNSRTLQFTIRDENDAVVDISAATGIRWELSKIDPDITLSTPKGAALVQKSIGSGVTIVDGPNGRCDVALDVADTEPYKGDFYHELRVVVAGETSTVSFGKVEILKNLVE